MKQLIGIVLAVALFSFHSNTNAGKWYSLFDGKTLNGWKVGDNASTFKVENGAIVVNGNVAHLFYDGPVRQHDFKNFEFSADVMTTPGSNSGIYFHTQYQQGDWPQKGYEVQVNNSHTDWRRTGSLWAIQDVKETYVKDNEWFNMRIKVMGKQVTVYINNQLVVGYTEPTAPLREKGMEQRVLTSGTFALQGHDPNSKAFYKNIKVRPL